MIYYNREWRIHKYFLPMILLLTGILSLIIGCSSEQASSDISVIPRPTFVDQKRGEFVISPEFVIYVDPQTNEIREIAQYFSEYLDNAMGLNIPVTDLSGDKPGNAMLLTLMHSDTQLGGEGYDLEITPDVINLKRLDGMDVNYCPIMNYEVKN